MFEHSARDPGPPVHDRLTWLAGQLAPAALPGGFGGRLVRRWLPAGPDGPGRRRLALVAVVVVVVGLIVAVVSLLGGKPAPEAPPPLPAAKSVEAPAPAKADLVVSVVGRVRSPGLITVPSGARVADVLRAAGGAEPGADLTALNLARRVTDGEQLAVGVPAPPQPSGAPGPGTKIDLNTATVEQLDTLPGVGAVMARRIVEWRTAHGSFTKVEQLRDVEGIGESKFSKLREQVTAG